MKTFQPRAEKPREGHQELLHGTHRLPPLRWGEDYTGGEATSGLAPSYPPTKSLSSSCILYCNPSILGALEYKDHQLPDIGHRSSWTRINRYVSSVILVFLSPPEPLKTCTLIPPRTTMLVAVLTPRQSANVSSWASKLGFSSTLYLHSNKGHIHVEPSHVNQNHSWLAYVFSYVTILRCFWPTRMLTKSSSTCLYKLVRTERPLEKYL
jgi:hypothetical protein